MLLAPHQHFTDRTSSLTSEQLGALSSKLMHAEQNSVKGWSDEFAYYAAAAWSSYYGNTGTIGASANNNQLFHNDTAEDKANYSTAKTREVHAVVNHHCDGIMSALLEQGFLIDFSPAPGKDPVTGHVGEPPEYGLMARHVENVIRAVPHVRSTIEQAVREALVAKVGFLRVEPIECPPQTRLFLNKTSIEAEMLLQQPGITPTRSTTFFDEAGVPRAHIEAVEAMPPKTMIQYVSAMDMVWPRGCRTFDQSLPHGPEYLGQRFTATIDELRRQYPAFNPDDIEQYKQPFPGATGGMEGTLWDNDDPRRFVHAQAAGEGGYAYNMDDETTGQITRSQIRPKVMDEYIRFDLNGDGYDELVNVRRIGRQIFYIAPVAQNPFVAFTPRPLSGSAVGESITDMIGDLQDQSTAIRRGILNIIGMTIAPRVYVNAVALANNAANLTLDEFLKRFASAGVGQIVLAPGDPKNVMSWEEMPTGSLAAALEAARNIHEEVAARTGVDLSRSGDLHGMGRTATGYNMQETKNMRPLAAIANNMAEGISVLARKVLRCEITISRGPITLYKNNQAVAVDPRSWDDAVLCSANLSGSVTQPEQRTANLQNIIVVIKELIAGFGADNPFMGLAELRNAVIELGRSMGFADMRQFVNDVTDEQMAEMAQRAMEMQQDGKAQAEMQKMELEAEKIQLEHERELMKMQMEAHIQQMKIAIESRNETARLAIEEKIKMLELKMNERMEIKKIESSEKVGKAQAAAAARNQPVKKAA